MIACSDDKEEIQPSEVEMIFNEPLTSFFGKTLENVKKAETRELIEEGDNFLRYKESKNDLTYTITYSLNGKNSINYTSCKFNGIDKIPQLKESISKKYKKKMNNVIYLSDDKKYIIYIVPQTTYTEVIYEVKN